MFFVFITYDPLTKIERIEIVSVSIQFLDSVHFFLSILAITTTEAASTAKNHT